jgi:type IV secretory pathway VirB2 component (pilin)
MAPVLRSHGRMSMHLFATPIECTQCGTVVDDPTIDRCPTCGALLKERRTPGRLAGVERKYSNIRFLLGFLRFLAVIMLLVGGLAVLFGDETVPWSMRLVAGLATVLLSAGLLVVAALFEVALDIEENTRAAFRIQQMHLEGQHPTKPPSSSE